MILALMPFGAGMGEYFLLLLVVLLVYGPRRLPDIARRLGRLRQRMQSAADGLRDQMMQLEADVDSSVEPDTPLSSPGPTVSASAKGNRSAPAADVGTSGPANDGVSPTP